MTGTDAELYDYTKQRVLRLGLTLSVVGPNFRLTKGADRSYGHFPSLNDVITFLSGYEAAKMESK